MRLKIDLPFTSRYLCITRPNLIIAASVIVFSSFRMDLYHKFWNRQNEQVFQQNQNNFYHQPGFINNKDDFERISNAGIYSLETLKGSSDANQQKGLASLAWYGPNPADVCLLTVVRNPGNISHDPIFQSLKCQEMYLCLLCVEKLESTIKLCIAQNNGLPSGPLMRPQFYRKVKDYYNDNIKKTQVFVQLQQVIQQLDKFEGSIRSIRSITDAKKRKVESKTIKSDIQYYTRHFVGKPGSIQRKQQMEDDITNHKRAIDFDLLKSDIYFPKSCSPGSQEYNNWFMKAPEGLDMRRSSVAYGVDKTLKMTFDEKHKYLSDRKYFVQRTLWPNGKNDVETLINLANINFWKKYDTKITFNTCKHCQSSSLADRNTHHRCELNKDSVLKGCGNFTHRRMLYPHDIVFALMDDDNNEDCVFLKLCQESRRELFRWEAYSVLLRSGQEICNLLRRPNIDSKDLGFIYGTSDTTEEHLLSMAVDKYLLKNCNNDKVSLPTEIYKDLYTDDCWFYSKPLSRKNIDKIFKGDIQSLQLLKEATCGNYSSQCDYYSIRQSDGTSKHHCTSERKLERKCKWGNSSIFHFAELPAEVARYLWLHHRQDPTFYRYNPLYWGASRK